MMKLLDFVILELLAWIVFLITAKNCIYVKLMPKVVIGILVRNKAFTLPYFFHYIEHLNYSRSRIGIIIYEDHSIDDSSRMVYQWCKEHKSNYAFLKCHYKINESQIYESDSFSTGWSKDRMKNLIHLRQKLISLSKWYWGDFLLMLDADVILTYENTISFLVEKIRQFEGGAIAPLLNCTSLPLYSNFWDNMTQTGYFLKTERYLAIKNNIKRGTFQVPVIHSVILLDLKHARSDFYSFQQNLHFPQINDDILNFAINSQRNNIKLLINNEKTFGYFPGPVMTHRNGYYIQKNTFTDLLFHYALYNNNSNPQHLQYNSILKPMDVNEYENVKINVDEIFVINLDRRQNRKKIINYMMNTMKIKFRFFSAIDGKIIDENFIQKNNISQMKGYRDPFFKRDLKYGEIGCFMSHFMIWKEMISLNMSRIIVLEDDIKCTSEFPFVVNDLIVEADEIYPNWEFFYLGRKIMSSDKEQFIKGSKNILIPNYSYRTTGYILTRKGAEKLINENPLQKMVALDEYIPIMYGKNPHEEWLHNFKGQGGLEAIACYPAVVQPSHFKGQNDYISDTEDSMVLES